MGRACSRPSSAAEPRWCRSAGARHMAKKRRVAPKTRPADVAISSVLAKAAAPLRALEKATAPVRALISRYERIAKIVTAEPEGMDKYAGQQRRCSTKHARSWADRRYGLTLSRLAEAALPSVRRVEAARKVQKVVAALSVTKSFCREVRDAHSGWQRAGRG